MTHFSAFSLLGNAVTGHRGWTAQWPDSEPKAAYDVVIVGAGGQGRIGETVHIPMPDRVIAATIAPAVFYDPEGARLKL